jgi:hypothetical protein
LHVGDIGSSVQPCREEVSEEKEIGVSIEPQLRSYLRDIGK